MFIDEVKEKFKDVNPIGIVKIQNVAEYTFINPKEEFDPKDVFSFKLPFPETWFEFKVPHKIKIGDKFSDNYFSGYEVGVLAGISDIIDEDENDFEIYTLTFRVFIDKKGIIETSAIKIFPDKRTGKTDEIEVDSFIHNEFQKSLIEAGIDDEKIHDWINKLHSTVFCPVFMFFKFYHCKNVHLERTNISERLLKSKKKRGKKDYFGRFYTLSFEPMKKILDKAGASTKGLNYAFHAVPGHFKEYKIDENGNGGLFGKLEGTWWWSDHVRGNPEVGIIHKNYDMDLKNINEKTKIKSRI